MNNFFSHLARCRFRVSIFRGLPFILAAGIGLSCGEEAPVSTSAVPALEEEYVKTVVNGMELTLRNEGGRCVLVYHRKKGQHGPMGAGRNTVQLDMEAPCNFVRLPGKPDEPQTYSSTKSDPFNRKVMLIVGGSPDTEFQPPRDKFMPQGCGSWKQKITIFDFMVQVEFPAQKGPNRCPSAGADQVEFVA